MAMQDIETTPKVMPYKRNKQLRETITLRRWTRKAQNAVRHVKLIRTSSNVWGEHSRLVSLEQLSEGKIVDHFFHSAHEREERITEMTNLHSFR